MRDTTAADMSLGNVYVPVVIQLSLQGTILEAAHVNRADVSRGNATIEGI